MDKFSCIWKLVIYVIVVLSFSLDSEIWYMAFCKYPKGSFHFWLYIFVLIHMSGKKSPQMELQLSRWKLVCLHHPSLLTLSSTCNINQNEINMKITQNCELFPQPLQFYSYDKLKLLDVNVVKYWVSVFLVRQFAVLVFLYN